MVFGISGVGKTTACAAYIRKNPEFIHVKASEILRSLGATAFTDRSIDTAIGDQKVLVRAIQEHRSTDPARSILLDAHSLVPSASGYIPVPTKLIEELNPDALFFLEARPDVIAQRRTQRISSPSVEDASELESTQKIARQIVEGYSRELSIPLKIVDVNDCVDL